MADTGDDAIRLGSMLFTIVEPHKGHEVPYNRWYERDHFYSGCMIGPWTLAGGRFVATRDCKARRPDIDGGIVADPSIGSYLAMYWIQDGKHGEWMKWAGKQVMLLHEQGRMFSERDHVHTQMYDYRFGTFRDEDGVPPELALDHGFAGAVAVLGEAAEGKELADVDRWYTEECLPTVLGGSSLAMCLSCSPLGLGGGGPKDVPKLEGSERKFLQLFFLDDDPLGTWDSRFTKHVSEFEATGLGRIEFASPFLATIPGTDTYTDQLW